MQDSNTFIHAHTAAIAGLIQVGIGWHELGFDSEAHFLATQSCAAVCLALVSNNAAIRTGEGFSGQLGPDGLPVVRAHFLPGHSLLCVQFNFGCTLWCDGAISAGHLREIRKRDSQCFCKGCCVAAFKSDKSIQVHIHTLFCESVSSFAKVASVKVLS